MKTLHCLTALAAASLAPAAHADIVFNEVMQSNVYTIMDELKDFPDSWVELYNTGTEAVNIKGWLIGLKDDPAKCEALRDGVVPAGGYLLIYCDKADIDLHTSFRIDSGKGSLYLFDPEGNKADEVTMKKMPAPDIAYGRKTDGTGKWGYMLTATPGAKNEGGQGSTVLGEVIFSADGGVWRNNQAFDLELYLPDDAPEGAKIIYTTSGKEPVPGSASVYTDPIYISTSKVVRAKVVCDGYLSRPSNCQSYIFLGREMQIPVISIAINNEYLYDNDNGIFATGSQGGWHNENYFYDWRRPMNVELFYEENEEAAFNQLGEMRVQGGYTRENALKSLALYANKRFGTKRFEYEFWEKDKPGITDNKSFILRNGGNDFNGAYIRDALCQRVLGRNSKNVDWQGYAPAIVYINGQYHAMLAIRERSNEDNIYSNYEGLEDIDMIENWEELKAGDWEAFNSLHALMDGDHSYEEWCEQIDVDSYCDMMALNYWIYNSDFPHNNIVMWRHRLGDDTRWRWLIKDCDFGLGIWNSNENVGKNYDSFLQTGTQGDGYTMYRKLMALPEFKRHFLDRMVAMHGDFLNERTFIEYLDEIIDENHGELQRSHDKWGGWFWNNLQNNLNFIREWCNKREHNMPTLMRNTFSLGAILDLTVNASLDAEEAAGLHVKYCGSELTKGVFDGKEYQGRVITLEGGPDDNIVAWDVQVGNNPAERIEGRVLTLDLSSKGTRKINAVIDVNGIADVTADASTNVHIDGNTIYADGSITVCDIAGRTVVTGTGSVTVPGTGIYIVSADGGTPVKIVL